MKYYYLINGKIMSTTKRLPLSLNHNISEFSEDAYNNWLNSLRLCEISESELEKVIKHYLQDCSMSSNPIEVTDIVELEWNKKYAVYELFFKQPKQVGEIEAVDFAEWILDNTAGVLGTKQRNYYVKGLLHGKYTTKQLYEIFKNQK